MNWPREDAGLAAVVGIDSESLVSGDSPEIDSGCLLLGIEGVIWLLGVIALRPDVLLERQRSLVRSITPPAMASKAPQYRSRRNLDSLTINSAKSSSRSSSLSACISFSMKARWRSIDAWANASRSVGLGVLTDESCSVEADCENVANAERFATPDGVVRPLSSSAECGGGVGRALAGNAAIAF